MTIRERVAEFDALVKAHPDETFLCLPATKDRSALLAAGDALAAAAQAFRGHVDFGRLRVGGRDANTDLSCALSEWAEIAG